MKALKKFEFKESGRGAASKHDWAKMFDGNIWSLTAGEDFTADKVGFTQACKVQAKRRGLHLNINPTDTGIVLQAHGHDDPDRESRAAEFIAQQKEQYKRMQGNKKAKLAAEAGNSGPEIG